jgi:hypothetical protein
MFKYACLWLSIFPVVFFCTRLIYFAKKANWWVTDIKKINYFCIQKNT